MSLAKYLQLFQRDPFFARSLGQDGCPNEWESSRSNWYRTPQPTLLCTAVTWLTLYHLRPTELCGHWRMHSGTTAPILEGKLRSRVKRLRLKARREARLGRHADLGNLAWGNELFAQRRSDAHARESSPTTALDVGDASGKLASRPW